MRQATQPIAIVSSGKQRTSADSRSGNISGDSSGDDEQEYFHPPLRDRPFGPNRNNSMFQPDVDFQLNTEDPMMVGSLPTSRRERRFLVSTGGQEVGGYGQATLGSSTRIVLAPKAWNNPSRQRVNSSPPPAPLLESRKDGERGDKASRIPKMALPESLATSLDSSSLKMSYGSLRENSFQRYYNQPASNQIFTVFEPKSLPHSTQTGSSTDIFSRLHSNNSIHALDEDTSNRGEDYRTNPVPIIKSTNKVGSVSALASLLGDYTIGESDSSNPVNKVCHGNYNTEGFGNDEPSRTDNFSTSNPNQIESWSFNLNQDFTMVQSSTLRGHDDFSMTSTSLTGLNILESTHKNKDVRKETNQSLSSTLSSELTSSYHLKNSPLVSEYEEGTSYLSKYNDQIDSGQQEAFDLEMDR